MYAKQLGVGISSFRSFNEESIDSDIRYDPLHKGGVQDAENETQRCTDLLKNVLVDKLEGYGKPDKEALDARSEFLLNNIQKSLQVKLNQIEAKKRLVDEEQDSDRRMLFTVVMKRNIGNVKKLHA